MEALLLEDEYKKASLRHPARSMGGKKEVETRLEDQGREHADAGWREARHDEVHDDREKLEIIDEQEVIFEQIV